MNIEEIIAGIESENEDLVVGSGNNLLSLLGGIENVLITLFVTVYNLNRDRIGQAADRAFRLSDASFKRLMKTLAIPADRQSILREGFDQLADVAGDLLVAIADAKRP